MASERCGGSDAELSLRVNRLTPGQKVCLLMVAEHLSSKEIAQKLGISSHTADQRVRQALRTLDVVRRKDAASLLARYEAIPQRRWLTPWPRKSADKNELTITWRLTLIVVIAGGFAFTSGIIMAALERFMARLREFR